MKHQFVSLVMSPILCLAINPCYAAGNSDKPKSNVEEIKKSVAQAHKKNLRVKVRFNSGAELSGAVEDFSPTDFKLRQEGTSSAATLRYADITRVKKESAFLKALKVIGLVAATPFAFIGYCVGLGPKC